MVIGRISVPLADQSVAHVAQSVDVSLKLILINQTSKLVHSKAPLPQKARFFIFDYAVRFVLEETAESGGQTVGLRTIRNDAQDQEAIPGLVQPAIIGTRSFVSEEVFHHALYP